MPFILIFFILTQLNQFGFAKPLDADWINYFDTSADIINNKDKKIGVVYAKQGTEGVLLRIKLKGLPEGIHGMHFHNVGNCEDHKQFQLSKGHINPNLKPHGFLNIRGPHEGNLPNLIVDKNGIAHVEIYSQMISISGHANSLLDKDGSSLIIHQNIDDHTSQPIGGSGNRIACGVFKAIKQ